MRMDAMWKKRTLPESRYTYENETFSLMGMRYVRKFRSTFLRGHLGPPG